MKAETPKNITEMAQKAGYDKATLVGKWKGLNVYEPEYNDNEIRYTGYPQYILKDGDKARWTKGWEESLAILKALSKQ